MWDIFNIECINKQSTQYILQSEYKIIQNKEERVATRWVIFII